MKKYIKNITGTEKFPLPQTLAYKEDGKIVLIKSGEQIETTMSTNIGSEARLVYIEEEPEKKSKREVK